MTTESPRQRMLTALDHVAAELEASGHRAYADRVQIARSLVAEDTSDRSALRTVVLSAIDAVLKAEATLGGELVQVLADMADPPLHEGKLGPKELSRALAVMVAMPDSTDRRSIGDSRADVLASVLSAEPAPRVAGVLREACVLAKEAGATHLEAVARRLQEQQEQEERRTTLAHRLGEGHRPSGSFEWAAVLKWLAMVAVAVGVLTSFANALGSLRVGALALAEWD